MITRKLRGIEPTSADLPDSGRDIVTFSQDRRTLSLDLFSDSAIDQSSDCGGEPIIKLVGSWYGEIQSTSFLLLRVQDHPMKSYSFDRLSLGLAFFIFAAPVSAIDSTASLKIDALVEEDLKKNGLDSNSPVSDAQFARRVYLDLIGRIPTPAELSDMKKTVGRVVVEG